MARQVLNTTGRVSPRLATIAAIAAFFCLTLMVAQTASASPITGEVAFVGPFSATGGTGPLDLEGATGLEFSTATVVYSSGDFQVNGVAPFFSQVTLTDFDFNFAGTIDPLWAVGVFQFALNTLDSVTQTANSIALSGTGIVSSSIAGLDPTAYNWSFSGDNSGGTLQLFSSTSSPTPLPVTEPSELTTLAMLVMGMGLFGMWSRKHRKALPQ